MEKERRRALASVERRRLQRRLLPVALAGSAALAVTGLADRLIQQHVGASSTSLAATSITPSGGQATTQLVRALNEIERVLRGDSRAVAALAGAAAKTANRAAEVAAGVDPTGATGSSAASLPPVPTLSLPSVPALPPIPSMSGPPAPPVHAVTGASVAVG